MPEVRDDRPEPASDTLCTPAPRPLPRACREACLVHIYPSGPAMGRRYTLSSTAAMLIGRGGDCAIHIEDHSVSRKHARIDPQPDGYQAVDLASTNGTYVNDLPVERQSLSDGDYLRVGNCIYRFLAGGNIEAEYHEEIYRLAIIDALTEIPNKRCLSEFLSRELSRAQRHHRPLAVIMFDVDRFKAVNDELGHLCGDHVLREMAGRLKAVVRAEELIARYGGEEFAVVLPECTPEEAASVAERLRLMVEGQAFRFDGAELRVTISLGVACTADGELISPTQLLDRADAKLYEAKRTGRNKVVS
jgi:two-component system cell cycle response regulator